MNNNIFILSFLAGVFGDYLYNLIIGDTKLFYFLIIFSLVVFLSLIFFEFIKNNLKEILNILEGILLGLISNYLKEGIFIFKNDLILKYYGLIQISLALIIFLSYYFYKKYKFSQYP